MPFPTALTNADATTPIQAADLNNLETKVGIDDSAVTTSLDFIAKKGQGGTTTAFARRVGRPATTL